MTVQIRLLVLPLNASHFIHLWKSLRICLWLRNCNRIRREITKEGKKWGILQRFNYSMIFILLWMKLLWHWAKREKKREGGWEKRRERDRNREREEWETGHISATAFCFPREIWADLTASLWGRSVTQTGDIYKCSPLSSLVATCCFLFPPCRAER